MHVTRYKGTTAQSSEILLRTRHESAGALRKRRVPLRSRPLPRICEVLDLPMSKLVRGLDGGIYEKPEVELAPRRRS